MPAINQIKGLLVSAPDALRAKYRKMATPAMITALQRSRPSGHVADPEYMTLLTLKTLATRYQALAEEITAADTALQEILDSYAPLLCDLPGVGPDVASQLLITVGDNRGRIGNEARFAALVGVAPIPASSGKTTRHRLSRGGDRNANRALHQVVLTRMASCPRTKNYVSKRTTEGKSKREIMRCLKRYVSREIYRQIFNPIPPPSVTDLRQKRKSLGLTVNAAAGELSQWPSVISRLERGLMRNDDLATSYRKWLEEQATKKRIDNHRSVTGNSRKHAESSTDTEQSDARACTLCAHPS